MSATRQAGVELCEMKIDLAECVCGVCLGGGGVTVCLSRRLLSTHTHRPGINTALTAL